VDDSEASSTVGKHSRFKIAHDTVPEKLAVEGTPEQIDGVKLKEDEGEGEGKEDERKVITVVHAEATPVSFFLPLVYLLLRSSLTASPIHPHPNTKYQPPSHHPSISFPDSVSQTTRVRWSAYRPLQVGGLRNV
jgi:hypothetical protein